MNSFVKVFAAPGIDSYPSDHGVVYSGAGSNPSVLSDLKKAYPEDWNSFGESQSHLTENLVGNFPATKAPNADSLKIRIRGVSPWHGIPKTALPKLFMKRGGIADMNPGAGHLIAGGPGAASSLVRVNDTRKVRPGIRSNTPEGQKLPVLPPMASRGGPAPIPPGGGVGGYPSAPIMPRIPGLTSIFKFGKAVGK